MTSWRRMESRHRQKVPLAREQRSIVHPRGQERERGAGIGRGKGGNKDGGDMH